MAAGLQCTVPEPGCWVGPGWSLAVHVTLGVSYEPLVPQSWPVTREHGLDLAPGGVQCSTSLLYPVHAQ